MRHWLTIGAVLLGYVALYLVFQGPLSGLYTPEWSSHLIPVVFAPVTVLAALPQRHRVAAWFGLGGYAAGVALGELVGEPVYQAQVARLEEQLRDPAYQQSWEPSHPGWWLTILVFAAAILVGLALDHHLARRHRHHRDESPQAQALARP